jgi:hypothetical protein
MTLQQAQNLVNGTTDTFVSPEAATKATAQIYLDLFAKNGGTVQGNITLSTTGNPTLALSGGNGAIERISLDTNNKRRWAIFSSSTTESTNNVGSNFAIGRYDDAGTYMDSPITITRSTGEVKVAKAPTSGSGVATKAYVDQQIAILKAMIGN